MFTFLHRSSMRSSYKRPTRRSRLRLSKVLQNTLLDVIASTSPNEGIHVVSKSADADRVKVVLIFH